MPGVVTHLWLHLSLWMDRWTILVRSTLVKCFHKLVVNKGLVLPVTTDSFSFVALNVFCWRTPWTTFLLGERSIWLIIIMYICNRHIYCVKNFMLWILIILTVSLQMNYWLFSCSFFNEPLKYIKSWDFKDLHLKKVVFLTTNSLRIIKKVHMLKLSLTGKIIV